MIKIVEAHNVPYITLSSPAYPKDLYNKFVKAKEIKGSRYMQMAIPCPPGWGFPISDTVKIAKLAVECGVVVLCEIENGKLSLTGRSRFIAEKNKKIGVDEYLERQQRFKKMSSKQKEIFQKWVDNKWNEYLKRDSTLKVE